MGGTINLRLRAALWCGAVAALPWGAFLWFISGGPHYSDPPPLVATFFAMPVTAAAISGFWIGWRLLDPAAYHDTRGAVLLGLAIALLAYVLMGGILLLIVLPQSIVQAVQAGEDLDFFIRTSFNILAVIWLVGIALLYTGWFSLPVACIAGYLLSRRYRRPRPTPVWP